MRFLDKIRDSRNREWWEKFQREHRWDDLARYNAERSRGLLHSADWISHMEDEQRAFDEAMGYQWSGPFPIRIDPA